jgi:hypothetical protein
MGMKSGDQAESGGDWRVQARDMRTVPALRAAAPPAEAAERLSDRALSAAAQNPDHSEAGRRAAAEAARARHVAITPWRLKVPGFIRPSDLAKGQRLFFGWGRRVRVWSGFAVLAMFAALLALAAWQIGVDEARIAEVTAQMDRCVSAGQCTPQEAAAQIAALPEVTPPAAIPLAILWMLALIVWALATVLRRKPARVLLLRKFNKRALSEPLSRMLAQELRPYGHIATLSDKHIRRDAFGWVGGAILSLSNPLAFAWFVLGLPVRFVWRLFDRSGMGPAVVLTARDYRNLARRLRDRLGLNAQVALVSKEAFMVRTSDAWWRMTVQLLMDSSDVIVVDLSHVTAGTAWELDVIQAANVVPRCVFVALWGKLEEAEAELRARGVTAPVHHYAPDGEIQRRPAFRSAMLAAMRAAHGVA